MAIATGAQALASDLDILARMSSGTYTGNNTADRAIPHGLGVVPTLIIIIDYSSNAYLILGGWGGGTALWYGDFSTPAHGAHTVTVRDSTNFYVGDAANYFQSANEDGTGYAWIALGPA